MFTSKLTTYFLVLSIAVIYVKAQNCACDDNVDGADAAVGSNAAGGAGVIGTK